MSQFNPYDIHSYSMTLYSFRAMYGLLNFNINAVLQETYNSTPCTKHFLLYTDVPEMQQH